MSLPPPGAEPSKTVPFTTPRFLKGDYFCNADERSAASPPVCPGGSGPRGSPRATGPRGSPRATGSGGTRARDHGLSPRGRSHHRALAAPSTHPRLRGLSPRQLWITPDVRTSAPQPVKPCQPCCSRPALISRTHQIGFTASLLRLLTAASRQDLPALPGRTGHPEQNRSPGASCRLCRAPRTLRCSLQIQKSTF